MSFKKRQSLLGANKTYNYSLLSQTLLAKVSLIARIISTNLLHILPMTLALEYIRNKPSKQRK